MTFPSVTATSTSTLATDGTTHTVTIPAVSSGNLILIATGINGNPGITEPSGFTFQKELSGSNCVYALFAKVSDGSEAGTVTFTTDASEESSHCVYVIDSWFGSLAGVETSTGATGNSDTPASGSLSPSWGADDNLYIASVGLRRGRNFDSFPTDQPDNRISTGTSTATSGSGCGLASRNLAASSANPAAFGLDGSTPFAAVTIAVRPAGGAVVSYPHNPFSGPFSGPFGGPII